MGQNKRFDVIVNDGEVYEEAIRLPEEQMNRQNYVDLLQETLADAEEKKLSEVHYRAIDQVEMRADNIQKIIFQESTIIDYLSGHDYPERIRVVCRDEDLATMYQMNYNFYYATEKSDRLGIEKWDSCGRQGDHSIFRRLSKPVMLNTSRILLSAFCITSSPSTSSSFFFIWIRTRSPALEMYRSLARSRMMVVTPSGNSCIFAERTGAESVSSLPSSWISRVLSF